MYHKISGDGTRDFLTVSSIDFESHLAYLQADGYNTILLSDLSAYVHHNTPLPPRPVMLTFDDGYLDNFHVMYPLLKKYRMKANIFLVASFIDTTGKPSGTSQEVYMSVTDIHAMDSHLVEFGLHSYDHKSYKSLSHQEISEDIDRTRQLLQQYRINFQQCLAFPYGAFPKTNAVKKRSFFNALKDSHILLAFRIGNRLNPLPARNPLLFQRIDIRGATPFDKFVQWVQKGKKIC